MKVYGWQGFRSECQGHHNQTREIVAAKSKAEVARIVGVKSPASLFNLGETWNKEEIAAAMSSPGTIFWKPISQWNAEYTSDKATAGESTNSPEISSQLRPGDRESESHE